MHMHAHSSIIEFQGHNIVSTYIGSNRRATYTLSGIVSLAFLQIHKIVYPLGTSVAAPHVVNSIH